MHIRTLRKETSAPHKEAHPMSKTYGCQGFAVLPSIESGGVTGAIVGDALSIICRQQIPPVGIAIGIAVTIGGGDITNSIVGVIVGGCAVGGLSQLALVIGRQGDNRTVPLSH